MQRPSYYVESVTSEISEMDLMTEEVSEAIYSIRESCWTMYLNDEVEFHKQVISHLVRERELPNSILSNLIESQILSDDNDQRMTKDELVSRIGEIVGDYSGRIMPYIYQLSLSTTNSRRSRAGTTFEAIIEYFISEVFDYPFESQAKLGTEFYSDNGVGKMVDGVIPSKKAYIKNRSKCQIITMKTTLRERWQEVVEELNRTNIPHIYLLTLDEGLTDGVLTQMKSENITVVTYDRIKDNHPTRDNVISFETFFKTEIPHVVEYWSDHEDN